MGTITIPSIDPTTFCRVCFADINLLNVIQPGSADDPTNQPLLQLVKTYLRLEFGGAKDFPCAVCDLCYRLLREFDSLYKNAQDNNEALKVLIKSKLYHQSTPPQFAREEATLGTQDSTLVEIIEPFAATEDESNGDGEVVRLESAAADGLLDGQVILEEVPYTETSQEGHQVHVFHLDGDLQQVAIAGNSSDTNMPRNGTKQPATLQPVQKAVASPDGRPLLNLIPVPRPSRKIMVRNFSSLKPEQNARRPTKKLYRCDNCPNLFVDKSKYYDHDCVKQNPRLGKTAPYWCNECNVGYRRELYWEKHRYEVHGICSENFGITCSICQLLFSQKQDYQLHVLAMHSE